MQSITLVGSSIFQAWTCATALLSSYRMVNRAIGGTTTVDWLKHLPEALAAVSPAAVLLYCGSNDLNQDIPPDDIRANVLECRMMVHRKSPTIRFAYFGIIKAPQKAGKWELIDSLNTGIASDLRPGDLYVDSNAVFFHDGVPVTRFFIEDGLHLTDEAYAQLSNYTAPILETWLSNRNA